MFRRKGRNTKSSAHALHDVSKTTTRALVDAFISGVSEGALDVGSATPFVGPIFVVLKEVYNLVGTARSNKDDLLELANLCRNISVDIIDVYMRDSTTAAPIGLGNLRGLVEEVRTLAKNYNGTKFWIRLFSAHKDKSEFESLRARINELIPMLGLSATLRSTSAFTDQMEIFRDAVVSALREDGVSGG